MSEPAPELEAPTEVDPWERWGWLMAAIWLIFLVFPVIASLDPALELWQHVVGITAVLAYAAVYLHAFFWCDARAGRHPWFHLAAMVALVGVTSTAIGTEALGMTPFLVSLAMFTTSLRAAGTVAAVTLLGGLAIPPLVGQSPVIFFAIIVMAVTVGTGLVRVIEDLGEEKRARDATTALAAERDRVARDVHDVLGHSLTVVTVKAELAERLVDTDPDRARAELAEIRSLTRQALAEIRATVAGLRVARLADELDSARRALSDSGIEAEVDADTDAVDPRHRIVLAWALREAVTNVVRHSGARRCTIEVGEDWLRVGDDGEGRRSRREGSGLRGLRERVAGVGGRVEVTDRDGGGTLLSVEMGSQGGGQS